MRLWHQDLLSKLPRQQLGGRPYVFIISYYGYHPHICKLEICKFKK